MDTRKAFTLIEMLVVIAIVALLAILAISAYGVARQQARRDIAADSLMSALRYQQGLAKTGRVEDDGSEGVFCYGMLFSVDEPYAQLLKTPYVAVGQQKADYCDVSQDDLQDFDPLEDFKVYEIDKFGADSDNVVVLFKPPFANVVLSDSSFMMPMPPGAQQTDIVISIGLPNDDDRRAFRFDTSSGLIERVYENATE